LTGMRAVFAAPRWCFRSSFDMILLPISEAG
jgi:hypothetical protein